jgi:hypothetical protein
MKKEKKASKYSPGERLAIFIFVISSGLYLLNILIGKAKILWGWKVFHLGDIGEFLLLLVASIFLIAAALHREVAEEGEQKTNQQKEGG